MTNIHCWAASMGPRPIGHGENCAEDLARVGDVASMGPRPIGHGEAGIILDLGDQLF